MSKSREARMIERRLQQLAPTNDRLSQADKRFFERFPKRRHRIRIAHRAEIESGAITNGTQPTSLPAGFQHFIAVKSLAPDCRFRVGFIGLEDTETDLSEERAEAIYESAKSINARAGQIEDSLLRALENRSQ